MALKARSRPRKAGNGKAVSKRPGKPPSPLRRLNALIQTARSGFFGRRGALQYGGERDVYDILGYDLTIEFRDFLGKYNRQDISGKIVDAPARVTWRRNPELRELDGATESRFIDAWQELERRLRIYPAMQRVDRISGIGHFGVMLLGAKGDPELRRPLPSGNGNPENLIFVTSFHEGRSDIRMFESNPENERFGLPTQYRLDLTSRERESVLPTPQLEPLVDWTRLIHVAEDTIEDRVFGRPRLERVWDRLDDLLKVVGGSSEMFWQNVARLWWMNIGADTDVEDESSLEDLEEDLFDALHGMRRSLQTRGVDKLEAIGGDAPEPKQSFDVVIDLIAAASGIPKRILLGSERGELASSQDEANWLGFIAERQTDFAEPVILRPTIDRLIEFNYLPAPRSGGYEVIWPNLFELSETQKAAAAADWGRAIKAAAPFEDPSALVPTHEFRERFLGLAPEAPAAPTAARSNELRSQVHGGFPGVDEFWVIVRRVAEGIEPELANAFLDAIDAVRNAIPEGALADAIASGEAGRVAELIPLGIFETELAAASEPLLASAFTRVADLAAREVAGEIGLEITFDASSPRLLEIVRQRTAAFVTEVSTESRLAIRDLVGRSFREGLTPGELASRIRSHIGLTRPQMGQLDRLRADLLEAGVDRATLDSMTGDFVRSKIRERAAVIARQESSTAANAGQHELFKQVEESGLVQNVQKEWIVTPDDRLCPICRPMAGQRQNVRDPFVSPFNGARAIHPPIHIQCRCASSLVFKAAEGVPVV